MKMTMPIEQHGTFGIKGSKQKTENKKLNQIKSLLDNLYILFRPI